MSNVHEKLLKVCEKHFDGLEDYEHLLLTEEIFLGHNAVTKTEREHLEACLYELEEAVARAFTAYKKLPSSVKSVLNAGIKRNTDLRVEAGLTVYSKFQYGFADDPTPRFTIDLGTILQHMSINLTSCLLPGEPDFIDKRIDGLSDPIKSAIRAINELPGRSFPAKTAEHWERIAMVDRIRTLWRKYKGRRPPAVTSSGPYYTFVEDIVCALGKNWDPEACLRSHNQYLKKLTDSKQ